jgi:hypothetical protein
MAADLDTRRDLAGCGVKLDDRVENALLPGRERGVRI